MKMNVIFKCGGVMVNKHSDGGKHNGWNNPFGENLPAVGDYIELGEHTEKFTHLEYTPMKRYIVKSRAFSAIEDSNNLYSSPTCVIELEEVSK
ncbi:MAG: hypothetical protein K0R00_9 [Herbinix sp.]|jgi:hypothetical protein|nr:hypothetical protein [Herbinix sp.]